MYMYVPEQAANKNIIMSSCKSSGDIQKKVSYLVRNPGTRLSHDIAQKVVQNITYRRSSETSIEDILQ